MMAAEKQITRSRKGKCMSRCRKVGRANRNTSVELTCSEGVMC